MVPHFFFTLQPIDSKLKVECRIFKFHKDMLVAIRHDMKKIGQKGVSNDTAAFCSTHKDAMPKGRFAIIYFCERHMTAGLVAHELLHASLALLSRRRIKSIKCVTNCAAKDEETLCYLVGSLTDAFLSIQKTKSTL